MRIRVKEQLNELIETMLEGCGEIQESIFSNDVSIELLEDCQEAAIFLGESIENSEGGGTQAVVCLEKYCEILYRISETVKSETDNRKRCLVETYVEELKSLLLAVRDAIKKFSITLEVAFFPYKASMWDSLESIWRAANENPRCHAVVVPIPYVDRNPDGSVKEEHYEINLYPKETPVVDYRSYDVKAIHPDIVFIHNPYDEMNLVTSVHSDYYSWKLKDYADCIVYVPYFALLGNLDNNYSDFSAYHHVNYIVTQTSEQRKSYPADLPDEMFLPFGSPKFDAIIHKCKNPRPIPETWRVKMEGKRCFFYNTSIRCAINEPDDYLKKMGEVFKAFAGRDDVCLVWRPHPLLEAAFDSMEPEYAKVFRNLRNLFISQGIGIYDDMPCMEDTISWCDVYLGDEGSSVIASFSMAEKPIYILDNHIHTTLQSKELVPYIWRGNLNTDGDDKWIVTAQDQLWHSERGDYHYEYVCDLTECDPEVYSNHYSMAKEVGGQVYVLPASEQNILIYKDGTIRKIELLNEQFSGQAFTGGVFLDNHLWLIPWEYSSFVRVDLETERVEYYKEERNYWIKNNGSVIIRGGICCGNNKIILTKPNTGELMIWDSKTLEKENHKIPYENGIVAISKENEHTLWLIPEEGYELIRYDMKEEKCRTYNAKVDNISNLLWMDETKNVFGNMAFDGYGKAYISPLASNIFVEVDIESGESKEWIPPFMKDIKASKQMGVGRRIGSFVYSASPDNNSGKRWIYDMFEGRMIRYNFLTGNEERYDISFDYEYLKKRFACFRKSIQFYCCKETVFYPFPKMLDEQTLEQGYEIEKQRAVNLEANVSLDGLAGKRILNRLLKDFSYDMF